jgi:ribosomal protein S18 acetylase RimI-like enzyme
VIRKLPDGYELDDDRSRMDLDAVYSFLRDESYWATNRPRRIQDDLVTRADRVVGLFKDGAQVGFARANGDRHTFMYLADVYVLEEHRGQGRGVELVREVIENGPYADVRWMLHTADAQGLYEKFGFGDAGDRAMERPRRRDQPDCGSASG